jgi:DNA modification methylase
MQWVKLSEVKANPNNPRVIRDEKFAKLKQSIIDFPEMLEKRPLVCYTEGEHYIVLGGNMRLKALSDIGAKEIPIILADEWTEEQRAQFLIKDNVGFGEWDWNTLANEWDADKLTEWGLDLPPIDAIELEAEEDEYEMPDEVQTDIVLGDLFEIGEHRLLCGDSTDSDQVAKLMNGQKADMVFTDPPYGMKLDADYSEMSNSSTFAKKKGIKNGKKYNNVIGDHNDFSEELINTIFSHFNNTKEVFIWGADYFAELLPNKNDGSWVVWDKRVDENFDKMYGSAFELCWSKNKHKREIARIRWASAFGTEKEFDHKRHHPTQKPTELASWFFNKWGNENDLIVDLYLGSGTSIITAHQLNRKCYGMELDPKYCQVIIDRMIKLDPTLEIKRNGQPYKTATI